VVLGIAAGVVAAGTLGLPRPGIPRSPSIPAGTAEAVVTVAPRYRASRIHRFWMGNGYGSSGRRPSARRWWICMASRAANSASR